MIKYRLVNNVVMPSIGLGTWQINGYECMKETLLRAFDCGYEMIDTAAAYGNEMVIGRALREWGKQREKIFIIDKLWNTNRGYLESQKACKKSLKKLKTDYIDMYLIHWPASSKLYENWEELNNETWRGLEALYKEGCVRAIGVCNFQPYHLEKISNHGTITPMVNQIEFHPGMPEEEIRTYCMDKNILLQASSPLGNGRILNNPLLMEIAARYEKSVAQICLRWAVQKGCAVIPKTTSRERMKENIALYDFSLKESDVKQIDKIPYCGGINFDPDKEIDFG